MADVEQLPAVLVSPPWITAIGFVCISWLIFYLRLFMGNIGSFYSNLSKNNMINWSCKKKDGGCWTADGSACQSPVDYSNWLCMHQLTTCLTFRLFMVNIGSFFQNESKNNMNYWSCKNKDGGCWTADSSACQSHVDYSNWLCMHQLTTCFTLDYSW